MSHDEHRALRGVRIGGLLLALAALGTSCDSCHDGPSDKEGHDGQGGSAGPPATGPWAEIEWPADKSAHNTVRLDVRGRAANLEAVFVNSDRVTVAEDGSWIVDLELAEGAGEIRVVAPPSSEAGEPTLLDAASVTIDLRAPVLLLTELPGNEHPSRQHVQVIGAEAELVGTIEDAWPGEIAELTLDGVPQEFANGTFRARLALTEDGDHSATLVVRDAAGNKTRLRVPLVRDTAPPTIRIDERVEQPGGTLMIRGTVIDATPLALFADGERMSMERDGGFELELPLEDAGRVQLVAEDAAGNLSEEVFVEGS